jgi:pimeloyl-ACP methyl ester carboxylesterase
MHRRIAPKHRTSTFVTTQSCLHQNVVVSRTYCILLLVLLGHSAQAENSLFAKPGKMVPVGKESRLSMYCVGDGAPTIILESGFGGGAAATWMRLQPLLGKLTRTCSYDRAGYGFSQLGSNLPRDLNQAVADLDVLLERSGETPPYILVGHSNGGLIIGAFADLHPNKVAGLVFLDAAVALQEDPARLADQPSLDGALRAHLDKIRRCLKRAEAGLVPASGDECVDPSWYSTLPADLAAAEIANRSKPDYWRAYLSEAENNYSSALSQQARALLPLHLPVRVFYREHLCNG